MSPQLEWTSRVADFYSSRALSTAIDYSSMVGGIHHNVKIVTQRQKFVAVIILVFLNAGSGSFSNGGRSSLATPSASYRRLAD